MTALAFSEDGKYLATYGAQDAKINFWQGSQGFLVSDLEREREREREREIVERERKRVNHNQYKVNEFQTNVPIVATASSSWKGSFSLVTRT